MGQVDIMLLCSVLRKMRCPPYENVLFEPRQEYYVVFLGKICNLNSAPLHSGES